MKGKTWKKLNDWKEKVQSQADKEILIKNIVQVISTNVILCFLLHANEIHSQYLWFANFIGGSECDRKLC